MGIGTYMENAQGSVRRRPYCTLFMLQSLDGKISTGVGKGFDFDRDLKDLVKGISSYYEAELHTDAYSMISGETCAKLGANNKEWPKSYHYCNHIIIDSHSLTDTGIEYMASMCQNVILVTDNTYEKHHVISKFLTVLEVPNTRDLTTVMHMLAEDSGVTAITVETGGMINGNMLKLGLIDRVDIFIAPIIVGGKNTPSIADGDDNGNVFNSELLTMLDVPMVGTYDNGMMRLTYDVLNTKGQVVDDEAHYTIRQ